MLLSLPVELTVSSRLCSQNATDPAYWARIGATFVPTARVNEIWYQSRGCAHSPTLIDSAKLQC